MERMRNNNKKEDKWGTTATPPVITICGVLDTASGIPSNRMSCLMSRVGPSQQRPVTNVSHQSPATTTTSIQGYKRAMKQ